MGRCRSLDSLKSFLWFASQLSRASVLFFSSWVPSGCTVWGVAAVAESLAKGSVFGNDWWLDGHSILCLLIQYATIFIDRSSRIEIQTQMHPTLGSVFWILHVTPSLPEPCSPELTPLPWGQGLTPSWHLRTVWSQVSRSQPLGASVPSSVEWTHMESHGTSYSGDVLTVHAPSLWGALIPSLLLRGKNKDQESLERWSQVCNSSLPLDHQT